MVDSISRQNVIVRVLAIILTATLLGLVVPVAAPATSAPRLDLPIECSVPLGPPVCTYRIDTRSPEEIFEEGFVARGDNDRLIEHAIGFVDRAESDSAFVATARDPEVANVLLRGRGEGAWVYAVWTSEDFYSLNSSLGAFAQELEAAGRVADAEHVVRLINHTRAVDEWSALNGIAAEHVIGAFPHQTPGADWQGWVENPTASPPETSATVEPYSVGFDEFDLIPPCRPGPGRVGPCSSPSTEEELADLHGGFDATSEDVRFTAFPEELNTDSKALLGPLTESNDELRAFDASTGTEGFSELRLSLSESIPADLARLEAVTASESLISTVMPMIGRSVDVASELLPYLGIAATGYALREDIDQGNWADAAFDSVALALQTVEMVQPELAVFVEPVLLADLAIQWIVGRFHPGARPAPVPDFGHLWEMYDELDSAPEALEQALTTVRVQHLGDAFHELRAEHVDGALDPRLAADLDTLERIRLGYVLAAVRHAVDAGDGVNIPTGELREQQLGLLAEIDTAFSDLSRDRANQYLAAAPAQLEASVRRTAESSGWWSASNDDLLSSFGGEVAVPHLEDLETQVFDEQRRTGLQAAIAYPESCGASPEGAECVDFRQRVVRDKHDALEALHYARLTQDDWWSGVSEYLSGDRPDAVWPVDFVSFDADPRRPHSLEQVCTDRETHYSRDGWQRATVRYCARNVPGVGTQVGVQVNGEYFRGLSWHRNDRPMRVMTSSEVRKHGQVVSDRDHDSTTGTAISKTHNVTHREWQISGGYVVRLRTLVSGMYWSEPSDEQGESDVGVERTLYIPAG